MKRTLIKIVKKYYQEHLSNIEVIKSKIDTQSDLFKENYHSISNQINQLNLTVAKQLEGGGKAQIERNLSRGKLLPRERINKIIDRGYLLSNIRTSFLEFSQLAGLNLYPKEEVQSGGVVTGIGIVHGKHVVISANDPTVKGGSYYPITMKKHLRSQEIAEKNNIPCIYLVDSGGGNLNLQAEFFADKEGGGRGFFNQARMSSKNIPQVNIN